jgi:hypothetical protein
MPPNPTQPNPTQPNPTQPNSQMTIKDARAFVDRVTEMTEAELVAFFATLPKRELDKVWSGSGLSSAIVDPSSRHKALAKFVIKYRSTFFNKWVIPLGAGVVGFYFLISALGSSTIALFPDTLTNDILTNTPDITLHTPETRDNLRNRVRETFAVGTLVAGGIAYVLIMMAVGLGKNSLLGEQKLHTVGEAFSRKSSARMQHTKRTKRKSSVATKPKTTTKQQQQHHTKHARRKSSVAATPAKQQQQQQHTKKHPAAAVPSSA